MFYMSDNVRAKLQAKHGVTPKDVHECFMNRTGEVLEDTSEDHKSDPPTLFFIAPNNHGRLLAVYYVERASGIAIRTCFEPGPERIARYKAIAAPSDF